MSCILIDDGFTLEGLIESRHGFPALKFTYRLAHPERAYAYMREPKNNAREQLDADVRLLTEHVVGWDAVDRQGNTIPANALTFRRVALPILDRMLQFILGYGPDRREADVKN